MLLKSFFAVAILATCVLAVPTGHRSSCSVECTPSNKFFYEIGKTYEYKYRAETRTGLSETSHEVDESEPGIRVEASVQIHPISPCEFVLSLTDVFSDSPSTSKKFSTELTKHSLRFSLQDGKVESICPSENEPVWVLNFKKGILSTFQSSMKSDVSTDIVTETDVSGVCKTFYESEKHGNEFLIKKSKVPTECTKKPQTSSQIASFGFNMDAIVGGMDPINSKQNCIQIVSDHIIQKVTCDEVHTFKPFSQQEAGKVYTAATTTLHFKRIVSGRPTYSSKIDFKTELSYDFVEEGYLEDLHQVEEILSKLEIASDDGIKKEVPHLFSELVSHMKALSHNQLQETLNWADNKHVIKFIYDALPLVGTPASNHLITNLILNGKYSQHDTAVYYISLAFIKNPTEELFYSAKRILEYEVKLHDKAMFGISSLVHNYCATHQDCASVHDIEGILKHFQSYLGVSCRSTDEHTKNSILVALKSIGNVGRWSNADSVLRRCFMENNPTEVRIAAIEAWRRAPCSYNRNHLLSTYEDSSYDSEVRIAAYLQVMKCPTQLLVDTLKDRLTSEGVNQVSSFVWSHLNNIQESAALDKQWIRELIGKKFLQDKYTTDIMKFSRYFESSLYSKELNVGGSVDADVIFSTESFIPRSAMLNLTVNMFGQSVNLFEVGGRIEGYEHFIEKFFGPNGYYPDETIEQVIKNLRDDKFSKSPELAKLIGHSTTDPKGSMFVRFLGNELFYSSHLGSEDILAQLGFKSPMDFIVEMFTKKSINYMKSFNLVKSKFTVPTITGFPLQVSFDGTATVGFILDGDFNVGDMNTFQLEGKLKPSAAVHIDSSMIVDAFVTQSGRKFTTTLHSSTIAEGKAVVKGLKLVDFSLHVPNEDMTVYEYSHDTIRIDDAIEHKEFIETDVESLCYPTGALGIQLCNRFHKNKNGELLSKRLLVNKMDTHTSYDFHFIRDDDKFSLMFDMPNSKKSNRHKLSYYFDGMNYEAQVHCLHMYKTIKGVVDVKGRDKMFSFHLLEGPKEEEVLGAKFSLENVNTRTGYIIKPSIKLTTMGEEVSQIKGIITNDFARRVFQVEVMSTVDPILFLVPSGNFEFVWKYGENSRYVSLKLDTHHHMMPNEKTFNMDLSGHAKFTDDQITFIVNGYYQNLEEEKTLLYVTTDIKKESSADGIVYKVSTDIPNLNFKFNNELSLVKHHYGLLSELQVQDGHWKFDTHYISKDGDGKKFVSGKLWFEHIHADLSYGVQKAFIMQDNSLETTATLSYGSSYKSLLSKLTYQYGKELSYMLNAPNLLLNVNIAKKGHGKLSLESSIKSTFINGDITGIIENQSTTNKIDWGLNTHVKSISINDQAVAFEIKTYLSTDGSEFDFDFDMKKITKGPTFYKQNANDVVALSKITVKATPSSIYFSSNLFHPFKIEAKLFEQGENNHIEAEAHYGKHVVEIMGDFSPKQIIGSFKSNEKMIKFSGQLIGNGLKSFIKWDPDQQIDVLVKYDNKDKTSVLVSVQTPFKEWMKQEIRVIYLLNNQNLESSINVIWKNTEHLNLHGKLDWNVKSFYQNEVSGKLSFISTIHNYENIQLNLDHKADDVKSNMQTHFEGNFGDAVVNAKLNSHMDGKEKRINFKFTSPYTKVFNIDYLILSKPLVMSLGYDYAGQKTLLKLQKYEFGKWNFKADSPHLPLIDWTASFQPENNTNVMVETTLLIDNKSVFYLQLTHTSENKDNALKATAKLINPLNGTPLSINSGILYTEESCEFDFDMSPIGNRERNRLKAHAKTNIFHANPHDLYIVGHYSGYGGKGSVALAHKFDTASNKINNNIHIDVNSFDLDTVVETFFDSRDITGSFTAKIKSSIDTINEVSFTAKHEIEDNVRKTLIRYKNGEHTSKIYHSVTFSDAFNWNSVLTVDNFIKATNKMSLVKDHFLNELEWNIFENKLVTKFEKYPSGEFKMKTSVNSPYASPLQIQASHEYIGENGVFKGKALYGEGEEITTQTEYLFIGDYIHLKHETLSKYCTWTPFEIEFDLNTKGDREVKLSASTGNLYGILLTLFDKQDVYGSMLSFEDKSTGKKISFEGSHLFMGNENLIFIEGILDEVYSAKINYSNLPEEVNMSSELKIPYITRNTIQTKTNYNVYKNTFNAHVTNGLEIYDIEGKLEGNTIVAEIINPQGKLNIVGKWSLTEKHGEMELQLLGNDLHTEVALKYSNGAKTEGIFYVNHNGKEYKLHGHVKDTKVSFLLTTPKDTYKMLSTIKASEDSKIEIILSKNSGEIKINGNMRFDNEQGLLSISIAAPFNKGDEDFISVMYNLSDTKEVKMEGKYANKHFLTRFLQLPKSSANDQKMVLEIKLPIQNYEEILIVNKNSHSLESKSSELTVHVMSQQVAIAKFLVNNNKIEFALGHTDIILEGNAHCNNGIGFSLNFHGGKSLMFIDIQYDKTRNDLKLFLHNGDFKADISGKCKLSQMTTNIGISFKTFRALREDIVFDGHITIEKSDHLMLTTVFHINGNEYLFKYSSNISKEHGFIEINMKTPFKLINEFSIEGIYHLEGRTNMAKLTTVFNKREQIFSFDLEKIANTSFVLKLKTPFEMVSHIIVEGLYDHTENRYIISGEFNEDHTLTIEGQVIPTMSGYSIKVKIPTINGHTEINGDITKQSVNLKIIDSNGPYHFIRAKYELEHSNHFSKINLEVESSYPELKKIVINSSLTQRENYYFVNLKIQKDEFLLGTIIETMLRPDDFLIYISQTMEGEDDYIFEARWNTQLPEKTVKFHINWKDFHHFFKGQMNLKHDHGNVFGLVKARSSLQQLENIHFEINVFLTEEELVNKCRFSYNDYDYRLTFHTIKMQYVSQVNALFEDAVNDNILSLDFMLNTKMNIVESKMAIGEKVFATKLEFINEIKKQRLQVRIDTPYQEYEHLFLNIFYDLTGYKNIVEVDLHHNTPVIELKAVLSAHVKEPEIHLKFNSRYTEHIEMRASLNLEDTKELINVIFKLSDSIDYALGLGYACNVQQFAVSVKVKCPENIFTKMLDFHLTTDFKFDESKNSLSIYFEKDGDVHINLNGSYFDDETSLSIHMPNEIFGNIRTRGSYNREKRSIEMQMMNDDHAGGLVANFHSLKINLQSPFKRMQKMSFLLTKDNNGKWVMNYKRNDNYLNYEVARTNKGIETKLDLSLPSWELLALTGRLSEEELHGYLTGKLPETKLSISGKGVLGKKRGEIKWELNSPGFPTLKKANAKFDYHVRKGTYTFNAKSSTNKDFKIFLQFKRGGLFIDVFVPHHETPTIAKGQLTIFKGKLSISSRFPAIKTYNLEYSVQIGKTVDIISKVERNGVQVFNLEFHKGPEKYHFLVETRRQGIYSKFHYHRMGWHHLDLVVHRNNKEFSANLKGSGNLPLKGEIAFVIKNSFRVTPREVTGTLKIDRTKTPKQMILRVERSPSEIITVTAKYNVDLKNLKKGDINLTIDTRKKIARPWKNINLEWEFDASKTGHIKLNVGNKEYKLVGKLSLKESDFVVSTNKPGVENRVYGWKIVKRGNYRDYMLKFGPERSYTLLAVSGTASDIRNVDMQGKIKSRFVKHALSFTAKWNGNKKIGISGDGTFEIGNKKGAFKLHRLKRDPVRRASTFKLTGTSNIKGFSTYSIIGEYDITARLIDIKIKWDTGELSLYTKIDNFTAKKSQNSAKFNIPGVGPSVINFGHDFTNPLDKTIKIDGNLGGKAFHYTERWTRNAEFTVLNLEVDIKSNFIGIIKMTADYDVRDIDNASGHIAYTRNGKNDVNVDWHRTKTDNSIVNEIVVTSKSRLIPSMNAYFKANWEQDKFIDSSIGVQWDGKKMEAVLNIDKKGAKFHTTNPFPYVDDITAVLKHDLQKKVKTITFNYERGQRKVNFSFVLNYKSKNKGSLDISLTTPFILLKKVMFNAKWNKGNFNAHYQRNDKKIDIAGKANINQGNSSYDFVFTPQGGNPIRIQLSYDLVDFLKKTSKKEQQIIHFEIDSGKHKCSVTIDGYSSKDKLILNTEGTSSLDALKTFRLRLDSELNLTNREGLLDIKINDFEYKMKNKFEKLDNGFYFRTQIHSTLTRLPGLTLGYGKDGTARRVTLGYGDEREISISLNAKDKFKKGLYGKIDIPRKGIIGIEYDIDYDFMGEDKFSLKAELRLKNGKKINYELDYHSDGIKARLGSKLAAIRRLRSKRSISDNNNMDDYAVTFQSGRGGHILNKGIFIEGLIFGKPFSIDTYLNIKDKENSQGKLLIQTPFQGYKKLGGYFTLKQEGQKLHGSGEVFFNGHASAEFETRIHGLNKKTVVGTVTYKAIGEEIPVSVNILANINEEQSVIKIQTEHDSSVGEHIAVIKILPRKDGQHLSVTYNNYKFEAEYVLRALPIYFKLNSEIHADNTVIHKGDMEISLVKGKFYLSTDISVDKENYNLKGNMMFSEDLHNVEFSSDLFRGCSMKFNYKNSFDRKQISFDCIGKEYNVIDFVLDYSFTNNFILKINSKYLPNVNFALGHLRGTLKIDADIDTCFGVFLGVFELNESFNGIVMNGKIQFGDHYSYRFTLKSNANVQERQILVNFIHNNDEYLLIANYMITDENANFNLEVACPLLSIEKSYINLKASWKNSLKFAIKTSIFNVLHVIEIEADEEPKIIAMNIISQVVPTGQGKLRLHIEGKSIENSKIELLLSNTAYSYFGQITTKLGPVHDKQLEIFLRTPINGYEEIRFGGGYKSGDMKKVYLYAHPFNYKMAFFMGNELNKYQVGFELIPGTDELPLVAAEAVIPLNKIHPHLSARYDTIQYDVDFLFNNTETETKAEAVVTHNGQKNGGKLYFTKNFPVEMEYEILVKSQCTKKFHIMIDSSILTFTNAAYLLL